MRWYQRFFRRELTEKHLDAELRFHLEQQIADCISAGMKPEQAQRRARLEFGGLDQAKEECRDVGRSNIIESLAQDVRYGLRTLRKSPGFAAVAVLTLALGIGANTAIFSLIDTILLKALPVPDPERLVSLRWESPQAKTDSLPYPTFELLRNSNNVFSGMFAFSNVGLATRVDGRPGLARGQLVTGSYFSVLGVQAFAGRTFTSEEDRVPGADPVAVISYQYWKRQFGLERAAVGKSITLNGVSFTIVGVTAPGFDGVSLGDRLDIWLPMMMQAQMMDGRSRLEDPKGWFFRIMARRKPGVSLQQAAANLNVAYQQIARQETGARITPEVERELAKQKIAPLPASKGLSDLRDRFATPLLVLMALVGLVLLVACANVSSLLLARANRRQREIAVRAALGAGRARLVRQLLTESLLLAALGSLVGLLLAYYGDDLLLKLPLMGESPLAITLRPNGTMLVFTAGITLLAAVLFGSAPAWTAARTDLNEALKAGTGRVATASGNERSGWGMRKLIVIGEVALSLLLVASAGMLVHSLLKLRDVNPGFNQDKVLLVAIDPTIVGYRDTRLMSLYKDLAEAISELPGVRFVSLSAVPPLSRGQWRTGMFVQGHVPGPNEDTTTPWNLIGPNFLRTLQIPLLQGRDFVPQDDSRAPRVAIINQAMAKFYYGNDSAVGKRLSFTSPAGGEIEIVGVAGDTRYESLREPTQHMLYLPYLQPPTGSGEFGATAEIRTEGSPESLVSAVREAIRSVGRDVPIIGFRSLAEEVNNSLAQERMVAELSSLFGLLTLILAAVGLYGVMTCTVAGRTGEIGIRMALGARRSQLLWMVLRESLELVTIGVVIGIPLVFVFVRLISSQLYGITRGDPLTICLAVALQSTIAAIASYIPARRATKGDPMVSLRHE